MSTFAAATAITPDGAGRFGARIDPSWGAPTGPNGGYVAAIAARALDAHLAPAGERQLRTLTCHYLRAPEPGELEIEVEQVRAGRRLATGRLTAHQHGREVLSAIAAYTAPGLPAAGDWAPAAPEVDPPPPREAGAVAAHRYREHGAGSWLEPAEGMPSIVHRVKLAPRLGSAPFSGRMRPGREPVTGGWVTLAEPAPLDAPRVALCADVWWPPAFEALTAPAIAPTIELTVHVLAALPPGGLPDQPVFGRYTAPVAGGGLMQEDGTLWLADGTLLARCRQLALLAPWDPGSA